MVASRACPGLAPAPNHLDLWFVGRSIGPDLRALLTKTTARSGLLRTGCGGRRSPEHVGRRRGPSQRSAWRVLAGCCVITAGQSGNRVVIDSLRTFGPSSLTFVVTAGQHRPGVNTQQSHAAQPVTFPSG